MKEKFLGRVFPFIPFLFGIPYVIFELYTGGPQSTLAMETMFIMAFTCISSWLFAFLGIFFFQLTLFGYYKKVFPMLSILYFFPALFLVLIVPWLLLVILPLLVISTIVLYKGSRR